MDIAFYVLTVIVSIATLLPIINHPHWFFRAFDFTKLQLFVAKIVLISFSLFFLDQSDVVVVLQFVLGGCLLYNGVVLYPYSSLHGVRHIKSKIDDRYSMGLLSANVYQFNTQYKAFVEIVKKQNPDIVLTMESNKTWELEMESLEKDYPNTIKVALENTYGMHFYTKLPIVEYKVNYYVASDIPSIEVKLKDKKGSEFVFIGLHPPPPSPTEEDNSLERDAELLKIAKRAKEIDLPVVVAGDFNNVSWSKSTALFKKLSKLMDAHKGRGFVSTFHANYWFFRIPIDQLFHSSTVVVTEFKALQHFGSDHFPLFSKFTIDNCDTDNCETEQLEEEEMVEIQEMIRNGEAENGNRDIIAQP